MNKENGDGIGLLSAGMEKVDLDIFDRGQIVRVLIDLILDLYPVKIIGPLIIEILCPFVGRT